MRYCYRVILGIVLLGVATISFAEPWQFGDPVEVTPTSAAGIFHHLESSGRRNIAASDSVLAVAWEDNRTGTPRIYLARKAYTARTFSPDIQISGNGEAFEPSLLALDKDQFVVAWEEDEKVFARLVTATALGPVIQVSQAGGSQASLASRGQQVLLTYSQREGKYQRTRLQQLLIDGQGLLRQQDCPLDSATLKDDQLYSVAISLGDRVVVAWEDRRPGHTIIMAAQSQASSLCRFSPPQRINGKKLGSGNRYGRGTGSARVTLARGADRLLAVWADKRDFREGYDIYASYFQPGKDVSVTGNVKVQDSFGGLAQQWHATAAGDDSGQLVVAWDDNRDGDANIMLSWREEDTWSEDMTVAAAAGPGEQNHPSICLDKAGNAHLAWIDRPAIGAASRLRYAFGQKNPEKQ